MGTTTICRIGAGAGFAGDRIDPAVTLAASGEVDVVALECLAERTLLPALKARAADPASGFDPRLRRRLTPLLPAARRHGCRIVSNLGQANPRAAGEAIARLARELGLPGVRVAAVLGDDVLPLQEHIAWDRPIGGSTLVGAHAYLGSPAMAQALAEGADVVVTGRVADSALFAAPAMRAPAGGGERARRRGHRRAPARMLRAALRRQFRADRRRAAVGRGLCAARLPAGRRARRRHRRDPPARRRARTADARERARCSCSTRCTTRRAT